MSASREKQARQERINSGWVDPKAVKAAEQRKQEKRSNTIYAIIAVVFVLVIAAALIWRSGTIQKNSKAVTVDGETYTAADVNFYFQNAYNNFTSYYSSIYGFLEFDASMPLREQVMGENAAVMMDAEQGITWHQHFLNEAVENMAAIQKSEKLAAEEGYVYPESVQAQVDESMASLETYAAASGVSVNEYLAASLGSTMTAKVYEKNLLRSLQYEAYMSDYLEAQSYSDAELKEHYDASPNNYDTVSYESAVISIAPEAEEPTEEETAAAKEAGKEIADKMLDELNNGEVLQLLADAEEKATYASSDSIAYTGDELGSWLFDDTRKAGDTGVVESASGYYVVKFNGRARQDYDTVNVRHILIQPTAGTLSSDAEGYEAEQNQLKADAKAQADAILTEWKNGEASEASFAQLAKEHSADSSKYEGGLYTRVYKGQMVEAFEDWCFDPARKTGDTGVVETPYGYHVMFFSGTDLPRWQAAITSELASEATTAFVESLSADADVQYNDFGLKFVS